MCMSKPIIMRRYDELYKDNYKYLFPVLNASNHNDVASALIKLYSDKKLKSDMGIKARFGLINMLLGKDWTK